MPKVASAPAKQEAAKQETKPAAFNWDALSEPTEAAYTRSVPNVDVEADTPAPLKQRVKDAYAAWEAANKDKEDGKRNAAKWFTQPVNSQEQGEQMVKLIKRYGRNTEPRMTVRGSVIEKDGVFSVRYSAKAFEVRDTAK